MKPAMEKHTVLDNADAFIQCTLGRNSVLHNISYDTPWCFASSDNDAHVCEQLHEMGKEMER